MTVSYKGNREDRGPESAPALKGSDLPKNQATLKIKCLGVRETPKNIASPVVLDIKEIFEKEVWFPNWTSLKNMADEFGDNLEVLKGKTLTLQKVLTTNPSTNKPHWTLYYGDIVP